MDGQTTIDERFSSVLDAAKAGAEWAWSRIYDELAPAILGYLRARGAPDAEGVLGEVFAQLVRDIERFEGDQPHFRSWVFVMVHHRLLDDLRRRRRRPEAPVEPATFFSLEQQGSVEDDVVRGAMEAKLREVLDELTVPQRDVLLLRIFGDLKIDEIADAVGRRPGAVKALQRRGLERLKELLEERGMYHE